MAANAIEAFEDMVFLLKGDMFEKYLSRWIAGVRNNASAVTCLRMLRRAVLLCVGVDEPTAAAGPASG